MSRGSQHRPPPSPCRRRRVRHRRKSPCPSWSSPAGNSARAAPPRHSRAAATPLWQRCQSSWPWSPHSAVPPRAAIGYAAAACWRAAMPYAAPLTDMRLVLDALGGLTGEAAELAGPVLDEAARFAAAALRPLHMPGDRTGSVLENGVVRTPPGFRAAYQQYIEGGWMGLAVDPEHGGQGLP